MTHMCGLLMFVSARGGTWGDIGSRVSAITGALESIRHRLHGDGTVLEPPGGDAILAGRPVTWPPEGAQTGRYSIVFTGALLNAADLRRDLVDEHDAPFAGGEDGELVAAAYHHWGPRAVNRLRGPFAFVLWDRSSRRAFGARDTFGVQPLHHLRTADGVWFASEKKALLAVAADATGEAPPLDGAALQHYLTLQYVPEPATLHRGIRRLGAGESFVYTQGGPLADRRYAQPTFKPSTDTDPEVLSREIVGALRDSVHAHTAPGSGVLLSSGIDSTAVAALAREVDPALRAFTVGYDVAGYSEVEVTEQSAAELGLPLTVTMVTPEQLVRALPRIVWHLDDPVADPALVPLYLLADRASRDVEVVLTGDGADEVFGGYPIYREPLSLAGVAGLPDPMQRGLRAVSRVIPQGVKGRSFLQRGTTPIEERYYGNARGFTEEEKATLVRGYDPDVRYTDVTAPVYAEARGLDDVTTMQHVDLYTWLRGDILVKADRMTAAHGLRLRTPFLDRAVFEIASTIPPDLKVPPRTTETKLALRRALAGVVPDAIVNRRKLGFPTPIRPWLRGPLAEWADDLLATSPAAQLLDLEHVRGLLAAHRKKDGDHSRKIWTVLVFCVWHGVFVSRTVPVPPVEPPAPAPVTQVGPAASVA